MIERTFRFCPDCGKSGCARGLAPLLRGHQPAVGVSGSATFVAIVTLGVICLVAALVFIPPVPHAGAVGIAGQLRDALAPWVLATLGLASLLFAGQFAAFTYLVPFLSEVTGISGSLISIFLFAYGAATAVGVFEGGRFADAAAARTLIVATAALFGALYLIGANPALVAPMLIMWGLVGMGLVPSPQYRVVSFAGRGRELAATLPASAINVGIAIGALAGGRALASADASSVMLVGLIICIVALPVAWATSYIAPQQDPDVAVPGEALDATSDLAAVQAFSVRGHTSCCQMLTSAEGSPRTTSQ